MKHAISGFEGFAIEASDGQIGKVVDFLFDDSTWTVRWLVVECGTWLNGRQVLLHPSAISVVDLERQRFEVKLTMSQVQASPDSSKDQPVSRRMEALIYNYYGWSPFWNAPYLGGAGAMAPPLLGASHQGPPPSAEKAALESGDPHLRSCAEISGYRIHARDGDIGHVENIILEDVDWRLAYLVVDTSQWWFGKRVLIAPVAVAGIEWPDHHIRLHVSREQVEASPPWDPLVDFNQIDEETLHRHYGWPGSGE